MDEFVHRTYRLQILAVPGHCGSRIPTLKALAMVRWLETLLDYENIAREIMEQTRHGTALHDVLYGHEYRARFGFLRQKWLGRRFETRRACFYDKSCYYRAGSPTEDEGFVIRYATKYYNGAEEVAADVEECLEEFVRCQAQRMRWYQHSTDKLLSMRKTQAGMVKQFPALGHSWGMNNEYIERFIKTEEVLEELPIYPLLAVGATFLIQLGPENDEIVRCNMDMIMQFITPKLEILQQMPVEMRGSPAVWEKLAQLGLGPGTPYETLD